MTPAARLAAAIELLGAIAEAPRRPADAVANDFFRARRFIGSGDRRAVSDRVWRVLRTQRRLTWWLDRTGGAPTPRQMAAASLLLEGWTFDGLKQAFSGGQYGAAPLLQPETAALRPLEGHTQNHPDMPQPVRLEIPDWIAPALEARFGPELDVEMEAALAPAPLDLRVNLLRTTRDAAQAALAAEGIAATPHPDQPLGPAHRRPPQRDHRGRLPVRPGRDPGRRQPARRRPGRRHPGHAGRRLVCRRRRQDARTGHDHGESRPPGSPATSPPPGSRARSAASAAPGCRTASATWSPPGDKWAKRRAGSFDRVLVDAPCTGTGTWRRNPDARLRLRELDLAELVAKQATILDAAARLVKPGGRLVYATCSLLQAENEHQVEAFLARTPGFTVVPLRDAWPDPPTPGPYLTLTPRHHTTDGFFGAILERAAV